jgi:hypothetical protein
MRDDPVFVERLAEVSSFYAEHGADADLSDHVLSQWADLLGCPKRDVVTMLRIADLTRWCVVRGFDPPSTRDDYDPTDDLTLLATAIGQQEVGFEVQPILRMAGLAALDRLAQVVDPAGDERDELDELRARLQRD